MALGQHLRKPGMKIRIPFQLLLCVEYLHFFLCSRQTRKVRANGEEILYQLREEREFLSRMYLG